MSDFKIIFRLDDSQYMTALRVAVGAVCASADLDIDGAEDMKVCVTEACLVLKGSGFESVEISLGSFDGFHAEVVGVGGEIKECDSEFSLALISALVTSCEIEREKGAIKGLKLSL